jgi:hypothetical protein
MADLLDCKDEGWLVAQAALDAARKLPPGPRRIEALKKAGTLRQAACEKLIMRDDDNVH